MVLVITIFVPKMDTINSENGKLGGQIRGTSEHY